MTILRALNWVAALAWLTVLVAFISGHYTPTKTDIALAMIGTVFWFVGNAMESRD